MYMTRQVAQDQDYSYAAELVQVASQDGRLTLEVDSSAFLPPGTDVATLAPLSDFTHTAAYSAQMASTPGAEMAPVVFAVIAAVLALLALYMARGPRGPNAIT